MKYKIRYTETLTKVVEVEAENEAAAMEEIEYMVENDMNFFDDLEMEDNHFEVEKIESEMENMTYRECYAREILNEDLIMNVHERDCPSILKEFGYKVPDFKCPHFEEVVTTYMIPDCAKCWDAKLGEDCSIGCSRK